jgi:hypothetical protein
MLQTVICEELWIESKFNQEVKQWILKSSLYIC